MTVLVHNCKAPIPHAPHTFDVVNPDSPTLVTTLSCTGT